MKTNITQHDFEVFEAVYKTSLEITKQNLDPEVFDKFAAENFISKGKSDDTPVWIAWHNNKLYPSQTIDNLKAYLFPPVNKAEETDIVLSTLREIRDDLDKLISLRTEKLF